MAKQLGIHQIKGKVGERSYYRTKGVELGISRSINQGLSARVKNGDEYANTRLNNAEFKNANAIASAAFNSVNTRKRGMMVNFAVAAMTKKALEDIKQGAGDWGARHPLTELDQLICDMLENHAKGGAYSGEFGTFEVSDDFELGSKDIDLTLDVPTQQDLLSKGIQGIQIVVSKCLAGEINVDGTPRLFAGSAISPQSPITINGESVIESTITIKVDTPSGVGMSQSGYTFAQDDAKHGFYAVLTILALRRENNKPYIMQEYCTFVALPLGQLPD